MPLNAAIQGFINNDNYNNLQDDFVEGRVCLFSKFCIQSANKLYSVIKNQYSFLITGQTTIEPLSEKTVPLPKQYFEFKQLQDVGTHIFAENTCGDILGRISGFAPIQHLSSEGQTRRVRHMFVTNESNYTIEVVLWDHYIDQFDVTTLADHSHNVPVVVACSSLQVRKYRGVMGLTTCLATRFYLNCDIQEIDDFQKRLPYPLPEIFTHPSGFPTRRIAFRNANAIHLGTTRVTIPALIAIDSTFVSPKAKFQCVAEIIGITNHSNWHYPVCPRCKKRVQQCGASTRCASATCVLSGQFVHAIPWYRLSVRVADGLGETEFSLFGLVAQFAIGMQVENLLSEQKADSDELPPTMLRLIGQQYLFTICLKQGASARQKTEIITIHVGAVTRNEHLLSQSFPEPLPISLTSATDMCSTSVPPSSVANSITNDSSSAEHATTVKNNATADIHKKRDKKVTDN